MNVFSLGYAYYYLSELSVENREKLWKTAIPNGGVFVALNESDQIVGFASGGKERSGEYPDYQGELYAIYLLKSEQRKGHGKQLMRAVMDGLVSKDIYSMLIWVLEANSSVKFYESMGGQKIDSMDITIGNDSYKEVAYGWKNL